MLLRPGARGELPAQLPEVDLELLRPVPQRGVIVVDLRVRLAPQGNESCAGTRKAVIVRIEVEAREEVGKLLNVIGVLWADEQVHVHEPALHRCGVQPEFDIREHQAHRRKASLVLVLADSFVGVGEVVVRHCDGLDDGRCTLECRQVVVPRGRPPELVVHERPRGMDVRLPPVPLRSAADHVPALPSGDLFDRCSHASSVSGETAGLVVAAGFRAGSGDMFTIRCRTVSSSPRCVPKARRGVGR